MTTPTVTIDVPLTPQVLQQAGVSISDALWVSRLSTPFGADVLSKSSRGKDILFRVTQCIFEATMGNRPQMRLS